MLNIMVIVRNNSSTFYNYANGEDVSQIKPTVVKIMFAVLAATFCNQIDANAQMALLTIFSIMLGFSFNVMFHLTSAMKRPVVHTGPGKLEREINEKRINKLAKELFYNVSYFNLLATLSIFMVLIIYCLSPNIPNEFYAHLPEKITDYVKNSDSIKKFALYALQLCSFLLRIVLYLAIIESAYTFLRIVGRLTFMFDSKLQEITVK